MYRPEDLIFDRPVYSGAALKKRMILSENFGSERLLLGGPHYREVVSGVLRQYERVACLHQVVLCGHGDLKVAVPAYSEVQPADDTFLLISQ